MLPGEQKYVDLSDLVPPEWKSLLPPSGRNGYPLFLGAIQSAGRIPGTQIYPVRRYPQLLKLLARTQKQKVSESLASLRQATLCDVITGHEDHSDLPLKAHKQRGVEARILARLAALQNPLFALDLLEVAFKQPGVNVGYKLMTFESAFRSSLRYGDAASNPSILRTIASRLAALPTWYEFWYAIGPVAAMETKDFLESKPSEELDVQVSKLAKSAKMVSGSLQFPEPVPAVDWTPDLRRMMFESTVQRVHSYASTVNQPRKDFAMLVKDQFLAPLNSIFPPGMSSKTFGTIINEPKNFLALHQALVAVNDIFVANETARNVANRAALVVWLQVRALKLEGKPYPSRSEELTIQPRIPSTFRLPEIVPKGVVTDSAEIVAPGLLPF